MTGQRPPPKVLHVVSSTDQRGAETAALELSAALGRLGHQSETVALAPGAAGGLDVPALGPSRFSPATLRRLRHAAAGRDVVIAHGSSTLPAVALATIATNTPFVYRSIGDPLAWVTTPARRARVRTAASRARCVVALWQAAAVSWHEKLGLAAERIEVIPNAVLPGRFRPATDDEKALARLALGLDPNARVALMLGALSPEKRVDLGIDAVVSTPDVTLVVAGSGPERAALEAKAAGVAAGRVRLIGQVADPHQVLAAADILVLASDTEGQPSVAIEAGLCGLPVVATRVGGLSEIVQDGVTGVLAPRGDSAALSAAVNLVLERRTEMGSAARHYCETAYNLETIANIWNRLIGRISGRDRYPSDPPR